MDMVILLLEKGSHINHRDIRGLTALMHATLLGKQDIVNLLLNPRYKVKINLQCCNGFTALMYAVELEHLEVVEMLLLKNAFIYTRNLVGDTTLDIARMLNHKELVKRLKN